MTASTITHDAVDPATKYGASGRSGHPGARVRDAKRKPTFTAETQPTAIFSSKMVINAIMESLSLNTPISGSKAWDSPTSTGIVIAARVISGCIWMWRTIPA
jgi:hypothetical protein